MIKCVATVLAVFLAASTVRAEDCPSEAPEDSSLRRVEAKKWFARGEAEAQANNDVAAIKDYQCSLMFVPHGSTAYNVAQLTWSWPSPATNSISSSRSGQRTRRR
jgi:nitrate reductase cytochrome c-type subunit